MDAATSREGRCPHARSHACGHACGHACRHVHEMPAVCSPGGAGACIHICIICFMYYMCHMYYMYHMYHMYCMYCVCVCVHVYMYICIYVHVHIYTYIHVFERGRRSTLWRQQSRWRAAVGSCGRWSPRPSISWCRPTDVPAPMGGWMGRRSDRRTEWTVGHSRASGWVLGLWTNLVPGLGRSKCRTPTAPRQVAR